MKSKKNDRRRRSRAPSLAGRNGKDRGKSRRPQPPAERPPKPAQTVPPPDLSLAKLVTGIVLAVTFFWAYWPTMLRLVEAWNVEPDYSHGFLVPPLALYFLWVRRDSFPGLAPAASWPGLILIGLSVLFRLAGALAYVDAVEGWSMLLWLAGAAWLLGGFRVAVWSAPAVAFLWFMIPLPYHAERMLSYPLQRVATKVSTFSLQMLGQPAISEGNTILLGDQPPLGVEDACSGLRIFMGIVALAFAYVIVVRRAWWERALLLASTLPVALIANSVRVVMTALLFQYVSSEAGHKFMHDFWGWVMIPFAAVLFAGVLWYLDKLFPKVEQVEIRSVVSGSRRSKKVAQPPKAEEQVEEEEEAPV